jgi:hypothetical protein
MVAAAIPFPIDANAHVLAAVLDADDALIRPPLLAGSTASYSSGARNVTVRTCSAATGTCGCAGDIAAAPTVTAGAQTVPWGGIFCAYAESDLGPAPRPWWAPADWTPFEGYGGDNRTLTVTVEEVNAGAWPVGRAGWRSRVTLDGVAVDVPYAAGKMPAGGRRNATVGGCTS